MIEHKASVTRILIVEDDEDDFILTSDYLNHIDFFEAKLFRAVDADGAVFQLESGKFDLCLLDYQLGKDNGISVLRRAKELGVDTHIIMLTGQSDAQLDQTALDMGAVDYVVKNEMDSDRFARSIRYALGRREFEKERSERLKAETENESKNKFLAHLSHELRTPLTAILGYTELMIAKDESEPLRDSLNIVLRNSRHLLNLLNDVLDLSKIAAGRLELHDEEVDLASFFTDIYALMQISALDKGLSFTISSQSLIPEFINTDSTRLRQVLINIISNAIKFTHAGSIKVTLNLSEEHENKSLIMCIKDTGVGIPKDKLESIFNPFTQVEDVMSKFTGGSGLGLAISNELIKRMGGQLTVESEVGEGSSFIVVLPLSNSSSLSFQTFELNECVARERIKSEDEFSRLNGRVLIVDDLTDIRLLIGHLVQGLGVQVEYAENGKEAFETVLQHRKMASTYDLVLMDIHMPVMNGIEATEKIRTQFPNLPIVALTAARMKGTDTKLFDQGFTDVLSKPVDRQSLVSMLERFLIKEQDAKPDAAVADSESRLSEIGEIVFVVEDDEDAAKALSLMLETQGIKCLVAHSVDQAVELYDGGISLRHVLLDLNLGSEDGLEVARHIRDKDADTPITILSGETPALETIQPLKINGFLQKPIQLNQLVDFFKK